MTAPAIDVHSVPSAAAGQYSFCVNKMHPITPYSLKVLAVPDEMRIPEPIFLLQVIIYPS